MRVAGFQPGTWVNGPGERVLLSLQGCTLACPGCFNPHTHTTTGGTPWHVHDVAEELMRLQSPLRLTISGGEPLQQAREVFQLLWILELATESVGMFTGFTLGEAQKIPLWKYIEPLLDFVIMGRFKEDQPAKAGLRGSTNQRIYSPSKLYNPSELELIGNGVEIHVRDGQQLITGFPNKELLEELCQHS